jgi:hypothetical protein
VERPLWEPLAVNTPIERFIGAINLRLSRWADLVARLQRLSVRAVTTATTLTENDDVLTVATAGGAVTVTLPLVAGTRGKLYYVKKTDASANNLTLDGNGSETIDGAATVAWNTQWLTKVVVSTGAEWLTVSTQ